MWRFLCTLIFVLLALLIIGTYPLAAVVVTGLGMAFLFLVFKDNV